MAMDIHYSITKSFESDAQELGKLQRIQSIQLRQMSGLQNLHDFCILRKTLIVNLKLHLSLLSTVPSSNSTIELPLLASCHIYTWQAKWF